MTPRLLVWVGLVSLCVLNAADVWSTGRAFDGGGSEGNPVAGWLIESGLLVAAKLAVLGVLVVLMVRARRSPAWLVACVWLVVGVYVSAVAGNLLVAWRA